MAEWFSSGHAVDLILAIVAAEFAFLAWRGRGRGLAKTMAGLFFALAPGACILLALRGALTGASWIWIAAWLTLALPIHVGDLIRRR